METDSTVFKVAVTPTQTQTEPTVAFNPTKADHTISEPDLPPSLYIEANKVPLVTEALGLSSYYKEFDTEPLSREIDSFVNSEINRLHLKNSPEVYKEVIKGYEDKLGLDKIDDPFVKLEKINQYVRVQQKLQQSVKEYEELMMADFQDLSLSKMKKWLDMRGIKTI